MAASQPTAVWRLVGLFALVFGVVLVATVLVWQRARQQDEANAQQRFAAATDELAAALDQRLASCEALLRSAAALFAASSAESASASRSVTRSQWREFTATLRLDRSHPGLQALGFAPHVPAERLAEHLAVARGDNLPHYDVYPRHSDPAHGYFPVFLLEPADWRNVRALGFDLSAEPQRDEALRRAREESRPIMTAPLVLTPEAETDAKMDAEIGVMMFWPLARVGNHDSNDNDNDDSNSNNSNSNSNSNNPAERLIGYVVGTLRLDDMVAGALADRQQRLRVTLTDVDAPTRQLYQSGVREPMARYTEQRTLAWLGRRWQLDVASTPAYEQQLSTGNANPLLATGSTTGILLAGVVVLYARQREHLHRQQLQQTQQLRQREERFQMLIDGAPNAMLMVDENGVIEWVNPQAERLFGYSRPELLGREIEMLLPDRYRQQHMGFRKLFVQAPQPRQMGSGRELFARRKDGSEVPVEIGLSPVQTDAGLRTISSIIDLSARRHAEERARILIEAAPYAVVLVNSSGGIELVNSQTEHLFGYHRSELLGQPVEILLPESFREHHITLRDQYNRAPEQRQMGGNRELFARHKSGRTIPVEVGLAPIIAGGQHLIKAAVTDITTRKEAERKLREQAEQLALANRYKSEFMANMSHELRTPLNSILILSEQLKNNAGGNLSEKQIGHADIIHRSGADLLNLINDILDLSKVEAGRMTLVLEPVNLRELLQALDNAFRPLADVKALRLQFTVADTVPAAIQTDSQRLHQVLRNLLSNAIKFTDFGRIDVTVSIVRDGLPHRLTSAEALCIAVHDTGIGIAAGQHDAVFQAFRQADGSTSRRFGGTGLGLTISRQLAELLGGALTLDSQLGLGSVFTVWLPLTSAPATTSDTSLQISGPSDGAPRLLIVEDDPVFAQVLVDTASQYGFTSYRTSSGSEALDLLSRQKFVALILDLLLPDISGWQVLREVRSQPPTRNLPVHIISCVQQPLNWDDRQICYLTKPVSSEDLHRLLQQLAPAAIDAERVLPVLLIEDNDTEREHYRALLQANGAQVFACASAAEALAVYREQAFRCVVVDLNLPDQSGFDLLQAMQLQRSLQGVGVIINTGMDLSQHQLQWLALYSASVVRKDADSGQQLMRAVQPFLGTVWPAPEDAPRNSEADGHAGRRVLLVDDDVRNIFAMMALLEQFQLEVEVARDGQEAVQKLNRDGVYDLVLMDMAMPVMDGYTATRILKQERKLTVPVVALTAHVMKGDREKCLQAGANDYLAKPVAEADVRAMLQRWLQPTEGE